MPVTHANFEGQISPFSRILRSGGSPGRAHFSSWSIPRRASASQHRRLPHPLPVERIRRVPGCAGGDVLLVFVLRDRLGFPRSRKAHHFPARTCLPPQRTSPLQFIIHGCPPTVFICRLRGAQQPRATSGGSAKISPIFCFPTRSRCSHCVCSVCHGCPHPASPAAHRFRRAQHACRAGREWKAYARSSGHFFERRPPQD